MSNRPAAVFPGHFVDIVVTCCLCVFVLFACGKWDTSKSTTVYSAQASHEFHSAQATEVQTVLVQAYFCN